MASFSERGYAPSYVLSAQQRSGENHVLDAVKKVDSVVRQKLNPQTPTTPEVTLQPTVAPVTMGEKSILVPQQRVEPMLQNQDLLLNKPEPLPLSLEDRKRAFEEILARDYARIERYALYRTHDQGRAVELAAEAFAKGYEAAIGERKGNPFSIAWYMTVVHNLITDQARTTNRTPVRSLNNEERPIDVPDTNLFSNPSTVIEKIEEIKELREAVGMLSDIQKQVVILYHIQELSAKEVAHRVGISEGNVRQVAAKARTNIRIILEGGTINQGQSTSLVSEGRSQQPEGRISINELVERSGLSRVVVSQKVNGLRRSGEIVTAGRKEGVSEGDAQKILAALQNRERAIFNKRVQGLLADWNKFEGVMSQLTPDAQRMLSMKYKMGYDNQAIAVAFNTTPRYVKDTCNNAITQIYKLAEVA